MAVPDVQLAIAACSSSFDVDTGWISVGKLQMCNRGSVKHVRVFQLLGKVTCIGKWFG